MASIHEVAVRIIWTWAYMSSIVAALMTGLLAVLATASLVADAVGAQLGFLPGVNPVDKMEHLIRVLGRFWVFAFLFISIVSGPMSFCLSLWGRRRRISAIEGAFKFHVGPTNATVRLADCTWLARRLFCDNFGCYPPWRRLVLVKTGGKSSCAMGFAEESRTLWERFFELTNVRRERRIAAHRWALYCILGVGVGMLVGGIAGVSCWWFSRNPSWVLAFTFLGGLDGLIYCLLLLMMEEQSNVKWIKNVSSPLILGLVFMTLGIKCGAFLGVIGILECAGVNGVVGWCLAYRIQRRLADRGS
ncbi:hypothetical protein OAS39_08445 [Pirellulales bacterium]|nr:hypothetical protein [Pirellulales bacterium]